MKQTFDEHFASLFGERWPRLRDALLAPPEKTTLKNPFGENYQDYSLDPASLYPVRALGLQPGLTIADFCASPGGKCLASIFELRGQGEWIVNDLSAARVARLKAVLHDCLPPSALARVRVKQSDASRWGMKYPGAFDRVLLDAPCSGERHLLAEREGREALGGPAACAFVLGTGLDPRGRTRGLLDVLDSSVGERRRRREVGEKSRGSVSNTSYKRRSRRGDRAWLDFTSGSRGLRADLFFGDRENLDRAGRAALAGDEAAGRTHFLAEGVMAGGLSCGDAHSGIIEPQSNRLRAISAKHSAMLVLPILAYLKTQWVAKDPKR